MLTQYALELLAREIIAHRTSKIGPAVDLFALQIYRSNAKFEDIKIAQELANTILKDKITKETKLE